MHAGESCRGLFVDQCDGLRPRQRGDYERWASYGLNGWSYNDVLPYFRKQEHWEKGGSIYRGGDGPLFTRNARYQDPLIDAYLSAASSAGYSLNDDYNGETQDGFGRMQMTIRRGHRESAATAYLHPVLGRSNLTVSVQSHVTRILFENNRATGVEYVKDGQLLTAPSGSRNNSMRRVNQLAPHFATVWDRRSRATSNSQNCGERTPAWSGEKSSGSFGGIAYLWKKR